MGPNRTISGAVEGAFANRDGRREGAGSGVWNRTRQQPGNRRMSTEPAPALRPEAGASDGGRCQPSPSAFPVSALARRARRLRATRAAAAAPNSRIIGGAGTSVPPEDVELDVEELVDEDVLDDVDEEPEVELEVDVDVLVDPPKLDDEVLVELPPVEVELPPVEVLDPPEPPEDVLEDVDPPLVEVVVETTTLPLDPLPPKKPPKKPPPPK